MLQLKDGDAMPAATGPEKQLSVSVWMAVPSGAGPQRWGTRPTVKVGQQPSSHEEIAAVCPPALHDGKWNLH